MAAYEKLLNRLEPDEIVYFSDAVHPEYQSRPAYGWVRRGERPAVRTKLRCSATASVWMSDARGMREPSNGGVCPN